MSELEILQLNMKNNAFDQIIISIFKMQRDILGFSKLINTIDIDEELMLFSKSDLNILIRNINNQLSFLKIAVEKEESDKIENVKNIIVNTEYNSSTYNINDDTPYWEDASYLYEGIKRFNDRITNIHNTTLANMSAKTYTSYLTYQNVSKHELKSVLTPNIINFETNNLSLREARNIFYHNLNNAIISLYDLCTLINTIIEQLTKDSNYNIKHNSNFADYTRLRVLQHQMANITEDYQSDLYVKNNLYNK